MENPAVAIIFFVLVVALIGGLAFIGWLEEKRRREAIRRLAGELNLSYDEKDWAIPDRYRFLDKLREGEERYAFNILWGLFKGHSVKAFDFHYETYSRDSKGRRTTHHHYSSHFVLEQPQSFPELRIYPENFLSRIAQWVGYEDIDFESVEFSKLFTVRSKEKKFAYDICHPRMMEYLIAHPGLVIEIEGPCLAISFDNRLPVTQIPYRLEQLVTVRGMFPRYLIDVRTRRGE